MANGYIAIPVPKAFEDPLDGPEPLREPVPGPMKGLSLILSWACALSVSAAEPAASRAGLAREVPNFLLLDYKGKAYELHRADGRAVVLFFTGNGCPIARQSITKIRELRKKFADQGVVFWMINSYSQDDRESIRKEAEQFKVGSLPVLMDQSQSLAVALGVRRTCEAIALNAKDGTIFYRGGIDDQLSEGAKKPAPTERYLETALTEFLGGKQISQAKAPVHGCLIAFEKISEQEDAPISPAQSARSRCRASAR